MSSPFSHRQYLGPADMMMIKRALNRVLGLYELDRHSEEEAQVAAVLVGEFQSGNITEDGLVAVFPGMLDLSVQAKRKTRLRKLLERWEHKGDARGSGEQEQATPLPN